MSTTKPGIQVCAQFSPCPERLWIVLARIGKQGWEPFQGCRQEFLQIFTNWFLQTQNSWLEMQKSWSFPGAWLWNFAPGASINFTLLWLPCSQKKGGDSNSGAAGWVVESRTQTRGLKAKSQIQIILWLCIPELLPACSKPEHRQ